MMGEGAMASSMPSSPTMADHVADSMRDLDSISLVPPPTWTDPVLAEGYLKKMRGFGQNRRRFFRATMLHFAFYTQDCGELISHVKRSDIKELRDLGDCQFEVVTSVAFGASGASHMVLKADSQAIKTRWLTALRKPLALRVAEENLFVEGYLKKVQPLTKGFSRTRWFSLTNRYLTYYEQEAGAEMARCDVGDIDRVTELDETSFIIHGKRPFSKSGSATITCQAEDHLVREKWLIQLRSISKLRTSALTPLPADLRPASDHYGVIEGRRRNRESAVVRKNPDDVVDDSEGNRFIRNGDL